MADQFSRTRLLLGQEGLDRLSAARVAVFGLGGVGGSAAEALARKYNQKSAQNFVQFCKIQKSDRFFGKTA